MTNPHTQAADALEAEYLAVANGHKKPGKLDLEPLVRGVQAIRMLSRQNAAMHAALTAYMSAMRYPEDAASLKSAIKAADDLARLALADSVEV